MIVREKLLVDDSPTSAEISYSQEQSGRGLRVLLEEYA